MKDLDEGAIEKKAAAPKKKADLADIAKKLEEEAEEEKANKEKVKKVKAKEEKIDDEE